MTERGRDGGTPPPRAGGDIAVPCRFFTRREPAAPQDRPRRAGRRAPGAGPGPSGLRRIADAVVPDRERERLIDVNAVTRPSAAPSGFGRGRSFARGRGARAPAHTRRRLARGPA